MRTLLAATAASALLLLPMGAYAQQSPQQTPAQQDLQNGVKSEHPTPKRDQIIRSETNTNGMNDMNGAGSTQAPAPRH